MTAPFPATDFRTPARVRPAWAWAWLALAAVVIASALAFVAVTRGPWFDEVFTLYMTRAVRTPGESLAGRWLQDVHPPLFYALGWLAAPMTDGSYRLARLMNFVPLAGMLGIFAMLGARRRAAHAFLGLFALLLCTNPLFVRFFGEDRSYLTLLCATSAVLAVFHHVLSGSDADRADVPAVAMVAVPMFLALNLHYYGAVFAGAASGVAILACWLTGRRRWAVVLGAVALASGLALVAAFLAQRDFIHAMTRHYWAAGTTLGAAAGAFGTMIAVGLLPNVIAVGLATRGLIRSGRRPAPFVLALLAMLAAQAMACLVLTLATGVMQVRYLMPVLPVAVALVATLVAAQPIARAAVRVAIVVNALILVVEAASWFGPAPNWSAGADRVAQVVRACPDARVHVVPRWIAQPRGLDIMPQEAAVIHDGQALLGRERGFRVEPFGSRAMSASCPTLLWAEDIDPAAPDIPAHMLRGSKIAVPPATLRRMTTVAFGSGLLLLIPPAS